MRILLPAPGHPDAAQPADTVDLHAYYATNWIDQGGVRMNFVSSVDGAATSDGLSRGLQTPGDNAVFGTLRDLADVILVGAATASAEHYRPAHPSDRRQAIRRSYGLAAVPAVAVMSSSLELDLADPLFAKAIEAPTLILTGSAAPVGRRNDIIDLAGGESKLQLIEAPATAGGLVDFAAAIEGLRELGYRRILCEGGPRLFGSAVAAGAVDELCLSLSPLLIGPAGGRILAGGGWPEQLRPRLELTGLLTEDGALFCRYRLRRA